MSILKKISEGKISCIQKDISVSGLEWNAHPIFKGVSLKHLVKGDITNNKFSCHLVKIEAGYEISEHVHESNWELHESLEGIGKGFIEEKEINYQLGVSVVIPEGIKHKVVAGNENLYLLAKFIPALI
ncbi:MAG: cupin [Desulfobacteraceae bacterium]|nr:cupin [Desulfobacteraceae bacterium]